MTELEACKWIQNQPGLIVYVGNLGVTLYIDGHMQVFGKSLTLAVKTAQDVLKSKRKLTDQELYKKYNNEPTRSCF